MIYAILARDKNNLIGNGLSLPWLGDEKTKWDMANFKRLTTKNIVFMGYKSFLGFKSPLPNRINVVETHNFSGVSPLRAAGLSVVPLSLHSGAAAEKQAEGTAAPERSAPLQSLTQTGFIFTKNLDDFLSEYDFQLKTSWKNKKIFIIGGAKTLNKYCKKIDFLYLTTFFSEYKNGETYLPENFLSNFKLKKTLESHENGKIELLENRFS